MKKKERGERLLNRESSGKRKKITGEIRARENERALILPPGSQRNSEK